jgi:hypothetical protein
VSLCRRIDDGRADGTAQVAELALPVIGASLSSPWWLAAATPAPVPATSRAAAPPAIDIFLRAISVHDLLGHGPPRLRGSMRRS